MCPDIDVTKSTKIATTCDISSSEDAYVPSKYRTYNSLPTMDDLNLISYCGNEFNYVDDTEVNVLSSEMKPFEMEDNREVESTADDTADHTYFRNITSEEIFSQNKDGDTLLHMAIILKQDSIAMYCIEKALGSEWLSMKNDLFQSPLHLAALLNQHSVARRLVVGGADVKLRDKNGNTPLHIACRDGHYDISRALMKPVTYPETKQNSYEIPYQRIPQDFSIKNYDGQTCLHLAAMNKHIDLVQVLLEEDLNINVREAKTGRTILHNACASGDLELVKLLLLYKRCDLNAKAYDESTPLDIASSRRHLKICNELAAAGACYSHNADEENEKS